MQTVDRIGFIAWCSGTLLHFENGVGVVAPERDCISADEALERGEKIALTQNGRIVSYAILVDGEIKEVLE